MIKICSECPPGNPRAAKARGLCDVHYQRAWKRGTLPPKKAPPEGCTETGEDGNPCQGKHMALGLCAKHYLRYYKHGTTELTEPQRAMAAEDRFWSKVDKSAGPLGDWPWTAGKTGQGYGQFFVDGEKWLAHRYAYLLRHGSVSEYLQIDHVRERGCRSRLCVNPAHLEAVTLAENVRRAQVGRRAENGVKTRAHRARTASARFWAKADQEGGPLACWPWQAFIDDSGGAKVWWQGRTHMAREVAWLLSGNTVPEGHTVTQACERRDCVNPAHLETVTTETDRARRAAIARAAKGADGSRTARRGTAGARRERSAGAKLTEQVVAECRRRYMAGEAQGALAAEFGVTGGAMSSAIRGRTWTGPVLGVEPVPRGLRPSQGTDVFREQMARTGRLGAAARWHPGSSQGQ